MALLAAYALMLAIPAAMITLVMAILLRLAGLARRRGTLFIAVAGSVVPALMVLYGMLLSWRQLDIVRDMIPPGPGLMLSALPAWLFSLAVSWAVLRRRKGVSE